MDGLKLGTVVVLREDALVTGVRGLMLLPDGGYIAVQGMLLRPLWTGLWTACCRLLLISGTFAMGSAPRAETRKVKGPICESSPYKPTRIGLSMMAGLPLCA